MIASQNPVEISFDESNKIRIFEAEKFDQTESMVKESQDFLTKMESFVKTVKDLLETMGKHADRIELHKLLAIGLRNQIDCEVENRKRQEHGIRGVISHRQAHLERLQVQLDSLTKVENAQRQALQQDWVWYELLHRTLIKNKQSLVKQAKINSNNAVFFGKSLKSIEASW